MLTLWRPHEEWLHWSRGLNDLLGLTSPSESLRPAVDVEEEEDRYVIRADLPGLEEKDIDVRVVDGVLVLSGKREVSREEKPGNLSYAERRYGSFCRQFTLGSSVDQNGIEATYKNGVLTVGLPKRQETKPRQIPVQSS
jgi:HSP20 family protein